MTLQITINERLLTVEKGISILTAARQHGIYIPTLCDYPGLHSHGSCRMCIVEIEGKYNTPTACTTPVEEGMVIHTDNPKVQALRKELLQLILAEHPSSCLFCPEKSHCDECMVTLRKAGVTTGCRSCPKDGQCELQRLVDELGITQADFPVRYRMLPVEKNDPFYDRDYNLCILCGRCVYACKELHFTSTISYTNRGTEAVVGTAFHRSHLEAGCTFCGACVEICPTGALSERTRKWDGKAKKETSTTCPLCSAGCALSLLSKNGTVIGSLPDHAAGSQVLCVKGRFGITELVNHPTRLKRPEKAGRHGRLGMAWVEALHLAAEKLSACTPGAFEMLLSTDCSSEDLYVACKFTHQVMKSNRIRTTLPAHYGDGLPVMLGLLRQSQPLASLDVASTILCLGLDGQYAQSVVDVQLFQAKQRGARIITLHPRQHSLSGVADEWLQPLPGQEPELINELTAQFNKGLAALQGGNGARAEGQLKRAARLLLESSATTVIVGPSFLAAPNNRRLLKAVEKLVQVLGAKVILLPAEGNLAGAFLMSAASGQPPAPAEPGEPLQVLYVIGESLPASTSGQPFIIYQNIYPPSAGSQADLLLPAAAFSEVDGTLVDHSSHVQSLRQAVPPPGQALPSWEILCRVARKMGSPGFEYASAAEIQAEIAGRVVGFQPGQRVDWSSLPEGSLALDGYQEPHLSRVQNGGHNYMGFPLAQWVEGLKMLNLSGTTPWFNLAEAGEAGPQGKAVDMSLPLLQNEKAEEDGYV